MNARFAIPWISLLGIVLFSGAAIADQVFLEADFNDKVIDEPIGTGGAAVGEPFEVVEITTGTVVVAADLWFDALADGDSCKVDVREHSSNQSQFAELVFTEDGSIKLDYGGSSTGVIGQFVTDRAFRVILDFDMDGGTFDVWLDGMLVIDDLAHGVTDRGIGKVRFGTLFDADSDGRFYVDAIKVTDYFEATAIDKQSWGRIKARFW
jgi:hypothetical protein